MNDVTGRIIGAAIEVHRALGSGLLESAYQACVCHELTLREIAFLRQVPITLTYKGLKVDCAYRVDLLIEDVAIKIKSVSALE